MQAAVNEEEALGDHKALQATIRVPPGYTEATTTLNKTATYTKLDTMSQTAWREKLDLHWQALDKNKMEQMLARSPQAGYIEEEWAEFQELMEAMCRAATKEALRDLEKRLDECKPLPTEKRKRKEIVLHPEKWMGRRTREQEPLAGTQGDEESQARQVHHTLPHLPPRGCRSGGRFSAAP